MRYGLNLGWLHYRIFHKNLFYYINIGGLEDYYQQWKFRHPQPDDLRAVFEMHSSKKSDWFFDDFIGTTKRLDYKIEKFENQKLLVKNNGEMISPLIIAGLKGDSVYFEKWFDGFSGSQWIEIPKGDYTEIKIDPNHVMTELYRLNNNIRTSGILPEADPVQTQLIFSIEDPEKVPLMYIPAVNWNYENGLMAGVAIYNGLITPKPIEHFIMPLYSFNNSNLAGFGKVSYNITPYNHFIRKATITLQGTQFGAPGNQNYRKLMAGLNVNFRQNQATNPVQHSIYSRFVLASNLYQILNNKKADMNRYFQIGYNLQNSRLVNPYKLLLSFESGTTFIKTAVDFNYKQSYTGKEDGLDLRFFAGAMLKNTFSNNIYSLAPGGRSGREQYVYEGTYPDRFGVFSTTFLSRQMTASEGGLISPVNDALGYSQWLVSLSLSSSLPGVLAKTGIKPFVNLLLNDNRLSTSYNSPFFVEAGFKAGIMNIFEIYFPLLISNNIKSITGPLKDRIRFVINLDISKPGK